MTFSPSQKATARRSAWLWGGVLGAILLPLLMVACYYGVLVFVLHAGPMLSPMHFYLQDFFRLLRRYGVWGGGLGCCGAMLWMGHRSLKWRLLSTLIGVGMLSYLLWEFWKAWPTFFIGSVGLQRWVRYISAATYAPPLLAALLLVFFALLLRSSRPLTAQS